MNEIEQLEHDMDVPARIYDYMDELNQLTENIEPNAVIQRLRSILTKADDAHFHRSALGEHDIREHYFF